MADITAPILDDGDRLVARLLGSCDQIEAVCEQLEITYDEDAAHELLAEANIERCPECDWWVDSGELADEEGDPIPCSSCQSGQ